MNQFIIGRAQALMDNIDTFIEVNASSVGFAANCVVISVPEAELICPVWRVFSLSLRWRAMKTVR